MASAAAPKKRVLLKPYGWGAWGVAPDEALMRRVEGMLAGAVNAKEGLPKPPTSDGLHGDVDWDALAKHALLPPPRFKLPQALQKVPCSTTPYDRIRCSRGMSLRDTLRSNGQQYHDGSVVDYVMFPVTEEDVSAILKWCSAARVAVLTRGGGSSVVGGIEPPGGTGYNGAICVDLRRMSQVVAIDHESMVVQVQGGCLGPELEAELGKHQYTLRHYPQSFEFSSVGGWVATRAGGHFATGNTHIDEFVHAVRLVTPTGVLETPRVPASGAGPDPKRFVIGSEGILGIITTVWLRIQKRPRFRAGATVAFPDFVAGGAAVRDICQSGMTPANCRLVHPLESMVMGLGDGSSAMLLLGFESSTVTDFTASMKACRVLCEKHGGEWRPNKARTKTKTAAANDSTSAWRKNFISAPYIRDALALKGVLVETFETAVSWARFPKFVPSVIEAVNKALEEQGCQGAVTVRLTHAYTDGCAPYFTVVAYNPSDAPAHPLRTLARWDAVKAAASAALQAHHGTCTHHHAVGRDHQPFYEQEVGEVFLKMLAAVKAAVDPAWVCNPGVLLRTSSSSSNSCSGVSKL